MKNIIIKSQETKTGVSFRCLRDNKFVFLNLLFKNYFYVKKADYDTHKEEFHKKFKWAISEVVTVGQFSKIIFESNWMRVRMRNFWEERAYTYEADIKANKRFLLDTEVVLNNTEIPFTFYDIETDDRLPLQKDDYGNVVPGDAKILSFAATNWKGEQIYIELKEYTDESEREMLKEIITYFSNYGIISGWNSKKFDMPYIKARCDAVNVDYNILEYVNHLDYLEMFKKYDRKSRKSYSLNNISNEVLHESKIDQAKGGGAIYRTWETDKEQLKRYNLEDSNLNYKIDLKVQFINLSMKMADLSLCHTQNTLNNSDFGDYLLMREYKKANIIMPSQPTKEQVEERMKQGKIGGGYTTCFEPGYHENVQIWDFASEYPSAIQTWNISPETFISVVNNEDTAKQVDRNKYIITPHDFEGIYHPARLYKKEEGIIPKVVRGLVEERNKTKYTMKEFEVSDPDKYKRLFMHQYALKTIGNSIYGILSFARSRYYSWDLGDSVTTCARATLKACNKKVEEWGCKVIGGDTDSSFVILGDTHTRDEIDKKYVTFLQEWADSFGCVTNKLLFEWEKQFDKMLFVKKKHYAYKIGDKITIKGMEAIKSDTNKKAAEMQRKFIEEVLNDKYDEKIWAKEIEELYNKVFNQELTIDELKLVKALTKMPEEYIGPTINSKTGKSKIKADGTVQMKAIPAHVKLAKRELAKGKDLYPGSKIQYIVIKDKPILAVSPEEYAKGEGSFPYKSKKFGEIEYGWEGGYAAKYYWMRILKPLIKVVYAYHKELPNWEFNLSKSDFNKLIKPEDD